MNNNSEKTRIVSSGENYKFGRFVRGGIWRGGEIKYKTVMNMLWLDGNIYGHEIVYYGVKFINCTFKTDTMSIRLGSFFINCIFDVDHIDIEAGYVQNVYVHLLNCSVLNTVFFSRRQNENDYYMSVHHTHATNSVFNIRVNISDSNLIRCNIVKPSYILDSNLDNCSANKTQAYRCLINRSNIMGNKLDESRVEKSKVENCTTLKSLLLNCKTRNILLKGCIHKGGVFENSLWFSGTWKSGTWTNSSIAARLFDHSGGNIDENGKEIAIKSNVDINNFMNIFRKRITEPSKTYSDVKQIFGLGKKMLRKNISIKKSTYNSIDETAEPMQIHILNKEGLNIFNSVISNI